MASSRFEYVVVVLQTTTSITFLLLVMSGAIVGDILRRLMTTPSLLALLRSFLEGIFYSPETKDVRTLVLEAGFEFEAHTVETRDGFLLETHRVRKEGCTSYKGVVFLQHGLYQTSNCFMLGDSLAQTFAKNGYDVWLGNNRGNIYCRRHCRLSSSSPGFWAWCIDDLAKDVEANVQYITRVCGVDSITYVGHSQGCAQALMALSSMEELREKVHLFVALAPGCFVRPLPSMPLRLLSGVHTAAPRLFFALFGHKEFLPFMESIRRVVNVNVFSFFALAMFKFLMLWTDALWAKGVKPLYFSETPGGTSTRVIAQWMQHSVCGRFQKYDHGEQGNVARYGTPIPPSYPLDQLTVPVAVFTGQKDTLLDHARLVRTLPRCVMHLCIRSHEHLDSLLARDAGTHLYPHILKICDQYNS